MKISTKLKQMLPGKLIEIMVEEVFLLNNGQVLFVLETE
jgi:hypothetical protein